MQIWHLKLMFSGRFLALARKGTKLVPPGIFIAGKFELRWNHRSAMPFPALQRAPDLKASRFMHCAQLNVLATVLVSNRDLLLRIDIERAALIAQQYWTVSRNRVGRWNEHLSLAAKRQHAGELRSPKTVAEISPLIEEVLVGQMFSRVLGGLLMFYDTKKRLGEDDRLSGLGHSIVLCHEDASNRALELLQALQPVGCPRIEIVNRLRRRIERWTDMLLAQMSRSSDMSAFCFDENRMRDIVAVNVRAKDSPTVAMLVGGVQAAQLEVSEFGFSPKLNHKLACMVLSCLPHDSWAEADVRLDTSVMRSDQFAWEIDRLVERAILTECSVNIGQAITESL